MNGRSRILYVGRLASGNTSLHRMNALKDLGNDIVPLDLGEETHYSSRVISALQHRLCWSPKILAFNRRLESLAAEFRPDIIWVDKGNFVRAQSIRRIKARAANVCVVHYNPDDPFGLAAARAGWSVLLKAIPEYDLHLVPRDVNLEEYKRAGARHVARFHWAFDRDLHRPVEISAETRRDVGGPVGFIGDHEQAREDSIRFLAEHGVEVRIWGTNWERARLHPKIRAERRSLWEQDYTQALCAFDINLGFLRKMNRDLSTTRSVEIPACGAFMLAERTDEHAALFKEGEEAEYFSSSEELLEKVRYYLAHPDARQRIAAAGRERCLRSGYSNHHRLADMLQIVSQLRQQSP